MSWEKKSMPDIPGWYLDSFCTFHIWFPFRDRRRRSLYLYIYFIASIMCCVCIVQRSKWNHKAKFDKVTQTHTRTHSASTHGERSEEERKRGKMNTTSTLISRYAEHINILFLIEDGSSPENWFDILILILLFLCERSSEWVCLLWIHTVCVLRSNFMHSKWYDSVLPWCFEIYFTFLFGVSVVVVGCCCCLKEPIWQEIKLFFCECGNLLHYDVNCEQKKATNETTNRHRIMSTMRNSMRKKILLGSRRHVQMINLSIYFDTNIHR